MKNGGANAFDHEGFVQMCYIKWSLRLNGFSLFFLSHSLTIVTIVCTSLCRYGTNDNLMDLLIMTKTGYFLTSFSYLSRLRYKLYDASFYG